MLQFVAQMGMSSEAATVKDIWACPTSVSCKVWAELIRPEVRTFPAAICQMQTMDAMFEILSAC